MSNSSRPLSLEEALARRADQVREDALASPEFVRQIKESQVALERGEEGIPLRDLQAQERPAKGQ